jgi:hypothetical protein
VIPFRNFEYLGVLLFYFHVFDVRHSVIQLYLDRQVRPFVDPARAVFFRAGLAISVIGYHKFVTGDSSDHFLTNKGMGSPKVFCLQ